MLEALDETYRRLGRYLKPDITTSPIEMGRGLYRPYQGRCSRTSIEGEIVDHNKGEVGLIPTHVKLLWLLAYQDLVKRDGTPLDQRITYGCVCFLPKRRVLSTVGFASRIPNLTVVEKMQDLVHRAVREERYLLLAFGKNSERLLGNGLRYSCRTRLEVNGEVKLAGLDIGNQTIDFEMPLRLSAMKLDWDQVRRYWQLRNRPNGLRPQEHEEMLALRDGFGQHGKELVRLTMQTTLQDIRIARWLSR